MEIKVKVRQVFPLVMTMVVIMVLDMINAPPLCPTMQLNTYKAVVYLLGTSMLMIQVSSSSPYRSVQVANSHL